MAQLKSTNVTGNLSVTGNILASKIIKFGGTADEILCADGSTTTLSGLGAGTVTSVTVTGNNGLTGTGTITSSGTITLSHDDTSDVADLTATDRTYVKSLTFDSYGHVTGYTTGAETVTSYFLPLAANGTRGGIQIGYSSTENNRAVSLSSEKAYIALPSRLYAGRTDSTAPDAATNSGFYYSSSFPASVGFGSNQGTMFVSSYDKDWVAQIAIGCYTNKMIFRKKGTGWSDWETVATESWVNEQLGSGGSFDLSGYVTGPSSATDNAIALYDGTTGKKIKNSGVTIDTNNNVSIPGKLTVSTGAYISGRAAGGGDDEGLIIGRASNNYAGLILGGATGKRSVFYLMPDTYTALPTKAVWRYNDGTNESEIAHPGKTGTIALLSDLGSGGDYDVSQVTVTAEDAKAIRYLTFVDAHETKKQSLKVDDDIYYAADNNYNWSSLNIGKSTKNGILTFHRYTGTADRYVNLQVQNAISTNYTVYMPPATGTIATQEWVSDNVDSANNSKITISTSGKGLSGSNYFNLNQSSAKTITITLDSSTAGNRTAEKVVIAAADGQINSEKYAITNDGNAVKATWQYNSSTDCIELVWA